MPASIRALVDTPGAATTKHPMRSVRTFALRIEFERKKRHMRLSHWIWQCGLIIQVLALCALGSPAQTRYTSDPNIADFTSQVSSYAALSNYSGFTCGVSNAVCDPNGPNLPSPFTPTSDELAAYGVRVFDGTFPTAGTNLPPNNNWLLATFAQPVASIMVFPNIDHYGSGFDGYQYQIYGSNDLANWTFLYDAQTVKSCTSNCAGAPFSGEPFTLAAGGFTGTAPTSVNNVLTTQSTGMWPACSGNQSPFVACAIGYIAAFNFPTKYQYYAFGASTIALTDMVGVTFPDYELSAVGAIAQQTFVGFQAPVTNCPAPPQACTVDPVKAGSTVPLKWQSFDITGNPITNLVLCIDLTGATCPAAPQPWVFLGYVPIACSSSSGTLPPPLDDSGSSGLQNLGGGTYQFNWKTVKSWAGTCATPLVEFSSGFTAVNVAQFEFF